MKKIAITTITIFISFIGYSQVSYEYDSFNRLVKSSYGQTVIEYTYDELGNRLTKETTITEDTINVPDINFRVAINQTLGYNYPETEEHDPSIIELNSLTGYFSANNYNIDSINGAQYLTGLTSLELAGNQIVDISAVSGLTNLTRLDLAENLVEDISPISGLTNLTGLYLYDNQIIDITAVSYLSNLNLLYLADNQIQDISAIEGLTNLNQLYLRNTNITNISALTGLINLTYLSLSMNNISDISPISGLGNLATLDLFNNKITDIYSLIENSGLGTDNNLYLENNPLSLEALYVHIPELQNRGFSDIYYPASPNNYAACYPDPNRDETAISPNSDLRWRGNFETQDAVYDVWLGESYDNLVRFGDAISVNDTVYSFSPVLNPNVEYWWKIRTITTTDTLWSGLWHFETGDTPEKVTITNTSISNDADECFGAQQSITVAGDGYPVDFQSGSTVNLVAGESISFLPGFHAHNGSYMYAYITTTGTFCDGMPEQTVVEYTVPETYKNQTIKQTGIIHNDNTDEPSIKIYPNPTMGVTNAEWTGFEGPVQISLFNSLGAKLAQEILYNDTFITINLTNYKKGIYFIKVESRDTQQIQKIMLH